VVAGAERERLDGHRGLAPAAGDEARTVADEQVPDVVKMNVFMVGDPAKGDSMDFEGLMKAYSRYFGTAARPNLPARTTVQVIALPMPGALVEIELVAARTVK
jgi:enamine deaminase RidA (YjgF/YER057c/UK114 family)